jgi:hypothetical protein
MSRPGYNSKVADILKGMNIDPKHQEKKEQQERPKYHAATAAILESIGVKVPKQEIVNEDGPSPLEDPGQAPMANTGKGNQQQAPQQTQQQPQPQPKPMGTPVVSLKKNSGGIKTLQDVSDKITEITKRMRTLDLLIQTMQSDDTTDSSIEQNKDTLKGPIRNLLASVKDLEVLVQ